MIINYFDVFCMFTNPFEAYTPLVVNTYAPIPNAVSNQFFKVIPGWNAQGLNCCRGSNHIQFPQRNAQN